SQGTSLFIVDADAPGFEKGRKLKKLGMDAQDTAELSFSDVRVPAEALLGELNQGFIHLMVNLPTERLLIGSGSLAAAGRHWSGRPSTSSNAPPSVRRSATSRTLASNSPNSRPVSTPSRHSSTAAHWPSTTVSSPRWTRRRPSTSGPTSR